MVETVGHVHSLLFDDLAQCLQHVLHDSLLLVWLLRQDVFESVDAFLLDGVTQRKLSAERFQVKTLHGVFVRQVGR